MTDGQVVAVAGTVTGSRHLPRLVQVDGFELDVPIAQHLAFLGYIDRPGVVGTMGRMLGEQNINIAGMQVGRTDAGGAALTVLTVDSAIPAATIDEIVAAIGAGFGRAVDLD
jgi:D-3-phosphoglycerate dehydrogenase